MFYGTMTVFSVLVIEYNMFAQLYLPSSGPMAETQTQSVNDV